MSSALHKRLQRLEELVAARVSPPIFKWMADCNGDPKAELDRLVAEGEVDARDKGRVKIWKWLTREEAIAAGHEMPPDPPPKPVQPQLPAPAELKLLPPPEPVHGTETRQESASGKPEAISGEPDTKPDKPPDSGKRGPLTEEKMRKMLEDRDRPFGRPIKYPKGLGMP